MKGRDVTKAIEGGLEQSSQKQMGEDIAEMAIRKAREHVPGRDNLSLGKFLQAAVTRRSLGELV